MNTRASLFLLSSALVCYYIIERIGGFVPRFYSMAYRSSPADVLNVMVPPTRLAVGYTWGFAIVLAIIVAFSIAALFRYTMRPLQITMVALCSEGLVFWFAMFCFCYEGFCGPSSLHRGPEFDFLEFVRFEGGVFPITLVGILIPATFFCVRNRSDAPSARD